jgi:hypothetical protein
MNLTFKEKFPELNDNQIKQLKRELLEIIGDDEVEPHNLHRTHDPDQIREISVIRKIVYGKNTLKAEQRQRLHNYMGGEG